VSDAPQTHAVLVARGHVLDVAEAYEAIGEQLTAAGRRGSARTQPTSRPPADLQLLAVRQEIDAWATWCGRAILDAHDAAGQAVELAAWTPALLRDIAEVYLGVFFADPLQAAEFMEAAEEHAHRARATAWPSGARWIRLHVSCPESGTDDVGRRVPCGGEYRMWMRPDQDVLGDMVCDRDREHRITPAEWQRAMRRKGVSSPDGAARLVRTIRLAGRAVAP
jgi:hypothetical protein